VRLGVDYVPMEQNVSEKQDGVLSKRCDVLAKQGVSLERDGVLEKQSMSI
jgi:hypothetical protein